MEKIGERNVVKRGLSPLGLVAGDPLPPSHVAHVVLAFGVGGVLRVVDTQPQPRQRVTVME